MSSKGMRHLAGGVWKCILRWCSTGGQNCSGSVQEICCSSERSLCASPVRSSCHLAGPCAHAHTLLEFGLEQACRRS